MRPRKFTNSCFSSLVHCLLPKDNLFKNTFDFTTAGDWDYVAVVERLPTLHFSVDFIFLSFEIVGFILELKTIRGSLMRPKWPKLASPAKIICTLQFQFFSAFFASRGLLFENIFDFTTADDWDFVAVVERLHAIHYSVDFIFLSFKTMRFIVEL